MTYSFQRGENWIIVGDGQPIAKLRYVQSRFNFNAHVFRFLFEIYPASQSASLSQAIAALLAEIKAALPETALLCRATVDDSSPLLAILKEAGFLEIRYVYEPLLELDELGFESSFGLEVDGKTHTIRPLRTTDLEELSFVDLYTELYARTSRLDPATPERVSNKERRETIQEGLVLEVSVCLVNQEQIVGLALTYEDADDPWVFYTCAAFPFQNDQKSVNLVWPLRWKAG